MRRQAQGFGGAVWIVILTVVVGLFPCACAGPPKPFVYETNRELKPGPGLFSGEDGVFTIYGKSEDPGSPASAENQTSRKDPDSADRGGTDQSPEDPGEADTGDGRYPE
jgi:hypothetical protein